jgi:hypothetical protein
MSTICKRTRSVTTPTKGKNRTTQEFIDVMTDCQPGIDEKGLPFEQHKTKADCVNLNTPLAVDVTHLLQ